ncbi:hypothetical protein D5R81_16435 [Parashewanella spongiae]|uniref:Uncharacterized protein n=1 Tax=Parashewanella spongiae TaxID=342950 RepID=A0A3A6TZP8_9GAMM|nr:hypothetical protein D5R81_16435 [Parashewanella spongiae]
MSKNHYFKRVNIRNSIAMNGLAGSLWGKSELVYPDDERYKQAKNDKLYYKLSNFIIVAH